jgi:ribokinase
MEPAQIVVVGSYNRDVALSVPRLPAPGETCLAVGRVEGPGGKGSNQAIQAARCGAATAMLAAIGADVAGDEALALWAAEGIDTRGVVRLAAASTGLAMILVDAGGENCIAVDPGANALLSPRHVEDAAGLIRGARLAAAQLETPPAAAAAAFAIARAQGVRTVLNAAPAPGALDEGLLRLTDVLVVNAVEGLALSGRAEPPAIAAALLPRVAEAVVLTLGARGALLFRPGATPVARPSPAVAVVDTTGAGDAFIGAFCARWAMSGDAEAALGWGVSAGALACAVRGASLSFARGDRIASLAADPAQPRAQ